jgi:hypothetical protein
VGDLTVKSVFSPEGGVTSAYTLPARRYKLTSSIPSFCAISSKVSLVKGRTIIVALPTEIRAVLLKPVEIVVSFPITSPGAAAFQADELAAFTSTAPFTSRILASGDCAKPRHIPAANSKQTTVFLMELFPPYKQRASSGNPIGTSKNNRFFQVA